MQLQIPEYAECLFNPSRYKVLYGGRGGAKSWAVAIFLLITGMNRPIRVLCARELQVSIADSVHKLLSDIINANPGMSAFYEVQNKSIFGKNGTEFSFKGLKHNANEIKSYEGVDYCWVEEAQAVSDKSWETLIPTIRKDGSEIIIIFNPKNATDPTWRRFVMQADEDTIVRKVGWQDNPFFPEVLNKERLRLLKNDEEAYNHIWEGEFDTRYSGSVYAKFVNNDKISPLVKHDPNYPVYSSWDKGYGDATAIVFFQLGNGEVFVIDYFEDNQEDTKYYCEVLAGRKIIIKERDLNTGDVMSWEYGEEIPEHSHRQNYSYHKHFVPHDAMAKFMEAGGRSMVDQARWYGVPMFMIPATEHVHSQEALRTTLPKCWINQDRCGDLINNLMNYHYEYDEDRKRFSKLPYHDWSSNGCDAAEIMARVWKETAVNQKDLDRQRLMNKFQSLRREHNMEQEDPYRTRTKK